MLSADSLTDSQKGRIDERPADSKAAGMDDGSRVPASRKRDGATVLQEDAEGQQQEAEGLNNKVADVQLNDRAQSANDDTHSKRARVAHAANITPQQSVAGGIQPEPEAAASAAPVSGGFGGLASKGANGFAFGGGSTFSGGFGSVAFGGGGFGSSAPASAAGAAAPSFASKASKDGAASPSEASNAGSGAQPAFSAQAMGSDTATAPEAVAQVFGSTPGAAPPPEEAHNNGEEKDESLFSCRAALYQYSKVDDKAIWQERGIGLLRLNRLPDGRSRIVMRSVGILRLLLNAWLFPELSIKRQQGAKQVTFTCVNAAFMVQDDSAADGAAAGDDSSSSQTMEMYAIKFGSVEKAREFEDLVEKHKDPKNSVDKATERAMAEVDAIAKSIV